MHLTAIKLPSSAVSRPLRTRGHLTIHANTLWSLAPKQTKSQFFEAKRNVIDLTGIIGARRCGFYPTYMRRSSEVLLT